MAIRKFTVPVTTGSGGTATAYSPYLWGYIESIQYVKGNFDSNPDFTITSEATGENIWTENNVDASTIRFPRAATQSTAGVDATYDGTRKVNDKIALGRDRVKIEVSGGGNTKSGTFVVTVDDAR
jgi:hypothetical protein